MLLTASTATALALSTVAWLPTGLRWRTNQFPIPYCISANATNTNVNTNTQRTAVLQGINAWVATGNGGSLSCTTYTAANATYPCSVGVNGGDQRFNVFWENNWSQGSGTIGVTWSTGSGGNCGSVTDDTGRFHNIGCKYDSDIELNNVHYFWTNSTTQVNTDITSIVAHEYGHFIGLDHCNLNNTCNFGGAIMYAAYGGGTVRVPFADDVQGACALYPGSPGGLGWPCAQNSVCSSNICVSAASNGYCTTPCGTCPTGYACGPNPANPNQDVCLRDDGLNRGLCEQCQLGVPGACASNGICIRGLPEQSPGRCVTPCVAGQCTDGNYQCLTVQFQGGGSGDFCFPRSNDCNDPSNFTELDLGQQCNGNPPCRDPLTCVGICAPSCNPGACPTGYGCESFQNNESYCLPAVNEGQSCQGLTSCAVGPCLINPGTQIATCYRDCAGNPGACNNAQQCNTYNLQSGGSVSICEQPGVPPLPPDAGVWSPDATVPPDDGGVVNPSDGGFVDPPDSGVIGPVPDAGTNPQFCACDVTFSCDNDPQSNFDCACDPECTCECDLSFDCDPGCGLCDPECQSTPVQCGNCTSTQAPADSGPTWLGGLLLAALRTLRSRRRPVR